MTLPKFSYKKQKSLRYRKIYNIDTGFSGIRSGKNIPDYGRNVENIVFLQLARNSGRLNFEVYYFKQNYEVDFVIYKNREVAELIQVASSIADERTLKREIRSLISAANDLNTDKLTILTLDEDMEIQSDGKRIEIRNIIKWMLEQPEQNY